MDTSPAEEVITDFIALGFTVDILYRILFKMEAVQCMELLITYGEGMCVCVGGGLCVSVWAYKLHI